MTKTLRNGSMMFQEMKQFTLLLLNHSRLEDRGNNKATLLNPVCFLSHPEGQNKDTL